MLNLNQINKKIKIRFALYGFILLATIFIAKAQIGKKHTTANFDNGEAIYKMMKQNINKKFAAAEIDAILKKITPLKEQPEFQFICNEYPYLSIESEFTEPAESLVNKYKEQINALADVCKSGVALPDLSENNFGEMKRAKSLVVNHLLNVDMRKFLDIAFLLLLESDIHFAKKEYDATLESLDKIFILSSSIRYHSAIGHHTAVQMRRMAAKSLKKYLLSEHPVEFDKKALELMNIFCAEPLLVDKNDYYISLLDTFQFGYSENEPAGYMFNYVSSAVYNIRNLKNRENIKFAANAIRRAAVNPEAGNGMQPRFIIFTLGKIGWTAIPAMRKYIDNLAKYESEILKNELPESYLSQMSNLQKVAFIVRSWDFYGGFFNIRVPAITNAEDMELIRLGYAAKIFKSEKNKFPDTVSELIPDYLKTTPVINRGKFSHGAEYEKSIGDSVVEKISQGNSGDSISENTFFPKITRENLKPYQIVSYMNIERIRKGKITGRVLNEIMNTNSSKLYWLFLDERVAESEREFLERFRYLFDDIKTLSNNELIQDVHEYWKSINKDLDNIEQEQALEAPPLGSNQFEMQRNEEINRVGESIRKNSEMMEPGMAQRVPFVKPRYGIYSEDLLQIETSMMLNSSGGENNVSPNLNFPEIAYTGEQAQYAQSQDLGMMSLEPGMMQMEPGMMIGTGSIPGEKPQGKSPENPNLVSKGNKSIIAQFASEDIKTTAIYSNGPDNIDDGGTICYDPTNGTFSSGDIKIILEAAK